MERKNNTAKDVLVPSKGNKEFLYYICLFGAAFLASVGLMIYAIVKQNQGLSIYCYVLVPTFLLAALAAVRAYLVSIDPIYVKGDMLYAKKFFLTKRIDTRKIDKTTVATFGSDHRVSVKISYGDKAVKYSLKHIDKDATAKLRKLRNS